MSGTSLDGLDLALCRFSYVDKQWSYHVLAADCVPYCAAWREQLHEAPHLQALPLLYLHQKYGQYLGEEVMGFLQRHAVTADLIASHGHTIFHEPARHISFQLGEGAAISAVTRLPVVSDFRSLDVCAGGQGAPLVPIGDKLLFSEYAFCLNLGGIANISYQYAGQRLAYDVSPCNLILNLLAHERGLEYDQNGDMARSGRLLDNLFQQLNAWPYYAWPPPKSLDKEALLSDLMPLLRRPDIPLEDRMATVTEHIAYQVGRTVKAALFRESYEAPRMLVTGGGAWNSYLLERIAAHTGIECVLPEAGLVNYKEAIVFAFLGLLRLMNVPNCLSSVTGAAYDNIGGALYGDFKFF